MRMEPSIERALKEGNAELAWNNNLEAGYNLARKHEDRIDEESFREADWTSDSRIKRDLAEVMNRKESFESADTNKKRAEILEVLVSTYGELGDWFGPNVTLRQASEYDDYVNGTDIILEHVSENGDMTHFAIDVTSGKTDVRTKLERIKQAIDRGELGEIKYVEDRDGNLLEPVKGIPKVILGLDANTTERLSRMWADKDTKGISETEYRYAILDEMRKQLSVQYEYALDGRSHEVTRSYAEAIDALDDIIHSMENIPFGGEWTKDEVYNEILDKAEQLFSSSKLGRAA